MAPDPFNSSSSSFILVGVPGLEAFSTCLGVLFCLAYVMALVGNGAVLLVTGLDESLCAPSHRLLAMLAAIDVLMVTAVVPKMLSVPWLSSAEIGSAACFVQMFLVHSTTSEESGLLLAMAVDRYVAICHPLRYQTTLSVRAVAQTGLAVVLRGLLFMVPLTRLVMALPYCGSRVVPHSYCEHLAVARLACADPAPAGLCGVAGSSLMVGADGASIAASYAALLRAALGHGPCRKALSTCGCRLCAVLLYYVPGIVSIYAQHSGSAVPLPARVLLADLYVTLPGTLNPLVYGLRSRPVRQALLRALLPRGARAPHGGPAFPGALVRAKAAPAALQGVPTVSRSSEQRGLLGFNETLLCEKSCLGLGERAHARPSVPSYFPDEKEKQEPTFEFGDVPSAMNIPVIIEGSNYICVNAHILL